MGPSRLVRNAQSTGRSYDRSARVCRRRSIRAPHTGAGDGPVSLPCTRRGSAKASRPQTAPAERDGGSPTRYLGAQAPSSEKLGRAHERLNRGEKAIANAGVGSDKWVLRPAVLQFAAQSSDRAID